MKMLTIRPSIYLLATVVTLGAATHTLGDSIEIDSHEFETLEDGSVLIHIEGRGFGEKSQPEPALWIFGEDVRENGVARPRLSRTAGESVPVGDPDEAVWSLGSGAYFDELVRHPRLEHSYIARNHNTLSFPHAYGGETPRNSDSTYFSYRVKPSGRINNYRSVTLSEISGVFDTGSTLYDEGESIYITKGSQLEDGTIVSIDPETSEATIVAIGVNASQLQGSTIIGRSSGAEATIDENERVISAVGSKYFRIRELVSSGIYGTLSTNRLIMGVRSVEGSDTVYRPKDANGTWDRGYGIPDISSVDGWRLVEFYVNKSDKVDAYLSVDSETRHVGNMEISGHRLDHAPSIVNLGWDAAGGTRHINIAVNYGEVYMDETPQRVVISSSPEYSQVTDNIEFQYPILWDNNNITAEVYFGEIADSTELYLYVFDENNQPNHSGYLICSGCNPSAPGNINLDYSMH